MTRVLLRLALLTAVLTGLPVGVSRSEPPAAPPAPVPQRQSPRPPITFEHTPRAPVTSEHAPRPEVRDAPPATICDAAHRAIPLGSDVDSTARVPVDCPRRTPTTRSQADAHGHKLMRILLRYSIDRRTCGPRTRSAAQRVADTEPAAPPDPGPRRTLRPRATPTRPR